MNLFLPCHVRDISNNLKLYQAEILKDLKIEQHHFAANVETGLKPILAGYDVKEVPISWINRSSDMGTSSFQLLRLAPDDDRGSRGVLPFLAQSCAGRNAGSGKALDIRIRSMRTCDSVNSLLFLQRQPTRPRESVYRCAKPRSCRRGEVRVRRRSSPFAQGPTCKAEIQHLEADRTRLLHCTVL